jgi:hypothetical protein
MLEAYQLTFQLTLPSENRRAILCTSLWHSHDDLPKSSRGQNNSLPPSLSAALGIAGEFTFRVAKGEVKQEREDDCMLDEDDVDWMLEEGDWVLDDDVLDEDEDDRPCNESETVGIRPFSKKRVVVGTKP